MNPTPNDGSVSVGMGEPVTKSGAGPAEPGLYGPAVESKVSAYESFSIDGA